MAVKLRLQRHGRKKRAFYHIVAVDARAPRDSKTIEKLGIYNPNTNPATIELNLESAVKWLERGAQPTDTTRAILSYKGAIYKAHLNRGVKKGALTQEQADAKFNAWLEEKISKIQSKTTRVAKSKADIMAERLKAETKKKEARAAKILAKNTPVAETATEENVEETTENVVTEEPVAEETTVEESTKDEVVEETTEQNGEEPTAE
ncbi:MAG: 30S ribosomal protein S16 [Bacteroidetes bacterium]|nr:30S ribosomal protein S16 [Bacteroidota bacterium]